MNSTACDENFAVRDVRNAPSPRVMAGALSIARRLTTFPALLAAVLVARVFWACRDGIAEPDIWWHLVNAKYILATHSLPNVDTHCFTTMGMSWTDHAWLSELVYYGAYRAAGLVGIYFAFATCLAIISVTVFWLCRREGGDPFAAAVATMLGTVLAMVGFGPRTHVFGWLCFTAMFAILLEFRSKKRAPLWAIPLIFCLWVNLHASWMFGLFVFAIILLAGLIRRDIGALKAEPFSKSEIKKLSVAGVFSVLALLVNPFGYEMLMVPVNMLFRIPLSIANVQEYASVNFNDSRGTIIAAVMCATFVLAFTARKPWRIADALLAMFVLYCGLAHLRFLFVTGIVLPPILAVKVGQISSYDGARERRLLNGGLLAIALTVLAWGIPSERMLESQIAEHFPVRALGYLESHPTAGHMFHLDAWGGYLEWHRPATPVFMDTRADIFEYKGVVRDYLKIVLLKESPQKLLDSYQISDVLFPADSALAVYLSDAPQWERVYADGQSVIYRRVRNVSKLEKDSGNGIESVNDSQRQVVTNLHVVKAFEY